MKKVALVFVLAVIAPSLVLAWLAVRSLRDQEFVLERQRSLLYQNVADGIAHDIESLMAARQHDFSAEVEAILTDRGTSFQPATFDELLRTNWPLANVGFVVSSDGEISCPLPSSRPEARVFCTDNSKFLANRETVEVYWIPSKSGNTLNVDNGARFAQANGSIPSQNEVQAQNAPAADPSNFSRAGQVADNQVLNSNSGLENFTRKFTQAKSPLPRSVMPQQAAAPAQLSKGVPEPTTETIPLSKVAPSEAEFQQLIGDSDEGTLARFVDNKLNVLFWHRSPRQPRRVFGAQLSLPRLVEQLRAPLDELDAGLRQDICVALLDDAAKPAAVSQPDFKAAWKHPFVSTEIGEELPHWEVAAYLVNPASLTRSARTVTFTLGLLIAVLVLAIGIGSWLIVKDLKRQLTLARQKTDFVSNVSHELKTPLTSIRMFSELLADGRIADHTKQQSYLNIVTAEAARLTRLINNVLDFSRLERGEKKYHFQECDLLKVVRETVETYRPHLENSGFRLDCALADAPLSVRGDCDALAQVIVNLLSNAEKYSNEQKEISVRVSRRTGPLDYAEVQILDRGAGVPRGAEERIFEKFYRAHDSLSSGIQGSGLGLTLARQIARAHGGDVIYETRAGGGSCFCLRLPITPNT